MSTKLRVEDVLAKLDKIDGEGHEERARRRTAVLAEAMAAWAGEGKAGPGKIKGTPNTPVKLRTLSVGDFYIEDQEQIVDDAYPAKITGPRIKGDGYCTLNNNGNDGWDNYDLMVHPLVRIGDDWWYKGSEPKAGTDEPKADAVRSVSDKIGDELAERVKEFSKTHFGLASKIESLDRRVTALESAKAEPKPADDIRPIGELPVGTEIDYVPGGPYKIQKGTRFVGKTQNGRVSVVNESGWFTGDYPPDFKVRVIRYPAPQPTPSHLDRLPEALREFIVGSEYNCHGHESRGEDQEELARAIWESRDDLFVAGEPVDAGRFPCKLDACDGLYVGTAEETICVSAPRNSFLANTTAIAAARRIAAIAKRGGE